MRLDRLRESDDSLPIPLTPLVDVLFLLIIFLVLGANFDQVETVRLPQARGEAPADAAAVLRLELRTDGELWHGTTPLSVEALDALVLAQRPARVLLLPDERAPVGPLLRWHDRIGREMGLPVQVGVQPPAP